MMKKNRVDALLSAPNINSISRILQSWKLLIIAFLAGGLMGAAVYGLFPPPYRAMAVVVMDQNLEEIFPTAPDREIFYFLERETQKLEELAWSDLVMQKVAQQTEGLSVVDLRGGMLHLSQPYDGGWRMYGISSEPETARKLANVWSNAFANIVMTGVENARNLRQAQKELTLLDPSDITNAALIAELNLQVAQLTESSYGIHPEIEVFRSQKFDLTVTPIVNQGAYLFAGAMIGLAAMMIGIALFRKENG